ncbi:MAG: phosphate ABC transporter permease PstA, partial [Thermoplasmata archaeon]|nr:phosphate ABC transporter permease PstA [Thermoplasmata archaeon]
TNVFASVKTLTGALGIEMGEAPVNSPHQHALFALAVVLFVIVLSINAGAMIIMKRIKERHYGIAGKKKGSRVLPEPIKNFTDSIKNFTGPIKRHMDTILGIFAGIILIWLLTSWFGIPMGLVIFFMVIGIHFFSQSLSPKNYQTMALGMVTLSIIIVLFLLGALLYYITAEGIHALSWEFLTESPRNCGREGGIYPAIIGTLYLTLGAIILAVPLGVGAGIYISEYAKETRVLKIIRAGIDNLNGTPSIVFGLFGYAFLVLYLGLGVSMIAGQITLALMVLPTIIRTTEEALKAVPHTLREGSLALGATKWETTRRVVLPPSMPGIITGIILSIGRAAGETAPIMFTAVVFSQPGLPNDPSDPVMALPYYILEMSMNIPGGQGNAAGAALVLLLLVLSFYLLAALIRKRFEKALKGFR